jgi:predicted protein (fragment)
MKKIITKAISLVSAIALTASLCAGCGKKGGNAGGDKAKVKDLGGLEITFTAMDKGWFIPAENADNYDEVMAFKEDVEKLFNCKINFNYYSPWDVYFQKIVELTMAGESVGDVCAFDGYIYPSSLLTGVFMPMQDYVNVKDYDTWEERCADFFNINGDVYAVSTKVKSAVPEMFCLYNKTLFEQNGLSSKYNLKELALNKKWTWDKFREVLIDSTIDKNGDGVTDIWGLSGQGRQFARVTSSLITSNNAAYTKKNGNSVQLTMTDQKFLSALEFMHKLTWSDKVISTDEKWTEYDTLSLFAQGKSMFYITTNWWIRNLQKMVDDTVISVLPVPIGPDTDDYAVNLKASNHTFGMLSTCKNPEEAGLVFQYWMENYPDDDKSQRDQWADAVFDSDSLDIIEMLSKCNITFDWSTPDTDKFKEVTLGQHGITERIPPATFVASVRDALQSEIDQLWSLAEK